MNNPSQVFLQKLINLDVCSALKATLSLTSVARRREQLHAPSSAPRQTLPALRRGPVQGAGLGKQALVFLCWCVAILPLVTAITDLPAVARHRPRVHCRVAATTLNLADPARTRFRL